MNSVVNDRVAHRTSASPKRKGLSIKTLASAVAISLSSLSVPAFAQTMPISPGYLMGAWKDNAQCRGREAMVFFPNNTMSSAGSIPVNYTVTGPAQFTMHGAGGAASIQAQYLNHNQMLVSLQNNTSVFYRCGGAQAHAGGNVHPGFNMHPGGHAQLSPAYIVGGWSHTGNCAAPEIFHGDGRFQSSLNAWGTWRLLGNVLQLMPSNAANADFFVQVNGPRNMVLTQNTGSVTHYARCF